MNSRHLSNWLRVSFKHTYCSAVLIGILAGFFSNGTLAQHERWYQVELIVFARQIDNSQEYWPTNIQLSYPINWVALKKPGESSADGSPPVDSSRQPFSILPDSDKKLLNHANALKRNSRYRVLFHNSWRQFIGKQTKAPAILISGGGTYDGYHELEGSITLSVAQYLKLETNLWLSQFEINRGQAPGEWPQIPKMPNTVGEETSEMEDPNLLPSEQWPNQSGLEDQESALSDINRTHLTQRIALMKQERRMRSREIHYIDHPLFGLIIQITPY